MSVIIILMIASISIAALFLIAFLWGVKSGQLTPNEAAKLDKGQQKIQKQEAKAKADGKVTAKEREHLQTAQDKQSDKIYKEKHDRQRDMDHDGKKDKQGKGSNKH